MAIQYDLHSHSTASDGTLTPLDLVESAAAAGVDVLALTDHDTVAGIAEARDAAINNRIQFVPGIEISVTWRGRTIHILGLHIDPDNQQLCNELRTLQQFRLWRAKEISRRLEKHGIPDTYSAASGLAGNGIVSRTHFARILVQKGHGRTMQKIFKHFLVHNKPGHVPGQWAPLDEAVQWIREAGGQAVIAHPARYRLTKTKLRQLTGEFRECSGAALEVVSGSHSRDEIQHMARVAAESKLLCSQGSDYHGPDKPWVQLGKLPGLPSHCEPIWDSEWWHAQSQAVITSHCESIGRDRAVS
jgi:predicted metal-dependent phosphoesterase TrpH